MESAHIFTEWKHLTRAFFSTKIALDREANFWKASQIRTPANTEIEVVRGLRKYRVAVAEHTTTLIDDHPLCAMALSLSYGLAESFARAILGLEELPGIETWGNELLRRAQRDWGGVLGGKRGLIEVTIARHAIAHGLAITSKMAKRFTDAGYECPWAVGSVVRLTFETTQIYRDRLRSLMRVCAPKRGTAKTAPPPEKTKRPRKMTAERRERAERRARKIAYRQKLREKAST